MVWSEGELVALKLHFFWSHNGRTNSWVALRSDRRTTVWSEVFWVAPRSQDFLGSTTVWSEGLGLHDGLIRGQSLGNGLIKAV